MKVAQAKVNPPSRFRRKIRNFSNVKKKPKLKKVSRANNLVKTEKPFRFTVKFKNFSNRNKAELTSKVYVDGDHEWRLSIFPKGEDDKKDYLSMYLEVANSDTLPDKWSIHVAYSLTIVGNLKSKKRGEGCWFNQGEYRWGFPCFIPLSKLHDPKREYLMNDTCVVEVEITDLKNRDRARASTLSNVYARARARAISNVSFDNDMETRGRVTKKRKGRTSDLPTPRESSKKPKDDKEQTLEAVNSPINSKLSAITVSRTNNLEQPFRFTVKFKNLSNLKNFSYSEVFFDGVHQWRLCIYPKGDNAEGYLSMFLEVANSNTLPDNWRIHVAYSLSIVNNLKSKRIDAEHCFSHRWDAWGKTRFMPLSKLHDLQRGYLMNMNDTCVVEVEITCMKNLDRARARARARTLSNVYARARARAISNVPKDDKAQTLEAANSPISEDKLVTINGYKVKAATAPTLKAVFDKYGDIAADCMFKTLSVKASLLEVICNIVQKLRCSDHDAILSNLEVIKKEISDVEASNINVTWLHEHLEKVHKVAANSDKPSQKVTIDIVTNLASRELTIRRAEMHEANERFEEAQKCETIMKLVRRKIGDDFICFEAAKKSILKELL